MSSLEIFIPNIFKVGLLAAGLLMCVFSMIVFVVLMIKHNSTPEYDERTHGDYGQNEDSNNLNENFKQHEN